MAAITAVANTATNDAVAVLLAADLTTLAPGAAVAVDAVVGAAGAGAAVAGAGSLVTTGVFVTTPGPGATGAGVAPVAV